MTFARLVTERLFLLLFWVARLAFLMQGLAMCTAMLAASIVGGQGAPAWVEDASRASLQIGATLFVTGVLLVVVRRLPAPQAGAAAEPGWPWPAVLGFSLVALSGLAYVRALELLPLWDEIAALLDQIDFTSELRQSGPYAGIVAIPILVALFVPGLESGAAFLLIVPPLALVVLLVTRSRLFPRIFVMLIACQAGLVLAGILAADAFSRLATEAIAVMGAAEDAEVRRVAEDLRRAQGVLTSTAGAFVAPMVGHLAWLPFLLSSRRVGAFFTAGSR